MKNCILKIFPPFLRGQFVSERGSLAQLRGRLRVAIPEIVLEGERDGWPYLVITRLSGVLGADAWPSLPEADKERVLARNRRDHCGGAARARRSARADRAGLGRLHARANRGMPRPARAARIAAKFLDGLDELLRDAAALIALDEPPVILTGEYIPENFLLSRDGRGGTSPG